MKTDEEKIEKLRKKQINLKNKYASLINTKLKRYVKFKSMSNVATMVVDDEKYKSVNYYTLALAIFYNNFDNVKYILLTRDKNKNIKVLYSDLSKSALNLFLNIATSDLQDYFNMSDTINNTINNISLSKSSKKPRL